MSASFKVNVSVIRTGEGFFLARAEVSPNAYLCTNDITFKQSLIGLERVECESRDPSRAVSYALAELAAKIGGGR